MFKIKNLHHLNRRIILLKYRPEIDGLRAIAVIAVIVYHLNLTFFDSSLLIGGFLGVDIFFVLSGYLITYLILKEIYHTNKFNLKNFYQRRVRRIVPALLLVTVVSSVLSYFILGNLSLIDFAKSVLSIIFFFSNIYFNYTDNDYGGENSLLKPLLHTWSVAVEEQFYILFPIFLMILIKFLKKYQIYFLIIGFIISLFFANFFAKAHPGTAFYQLPFRAFELLVGSLLAFCELNYIFKIKKHSKLYYLKKIYPSIGIALILFSFIFFDYNKISHPGFVTLLPIAGTAFVIFSSQKQELITKILSSKYLVFLGIISYSLYLWHYPIFAYLRYINLFDNYVWIKLLAVLLTIGLSVFTYYFIEKPFRNKKTITFKKLTIFILISVIILFVYSLYIIKTDGIKNKYPNIITENLRTTNYKIERKDGNLGNIFLIGDSHAASISYQLNLELKKRDYSFYFNNLNVYYLPGFNLIDKKTKLINKNHLENVEYEEKFLKEHKNLIVVWSQLWTRSLTEEFFDNEEGHKDYQIEKFSKTKEYYEPINSQVLLKDRRLYFAEGIRSAAKDILNQGHILILIYPIPETGFDPVQLLSQKIIYNKYIKRNNDIPVLSTNYDIYKKRNKLILEILDGIDGPNVYRVYSNFFFCNTVIKNRCIVNNKKHLFYYDHNHLSTEGSKYIVNDILRIIKQIELNKDKLIR